ncbi:MAG: sulfatase [Opitutales bacterium]|nr:sulfatase [Opitutales bacterium]
MKFLNYISQFVSCLLIFLTSLDASAAKKPNILLITADDLGWDSLGCMGNPLKGLSPNLDRLASEGLLIKHGYVATPICGPSRQALYTGRFPQSTGLMGHGVQPPNWWKAKRSNAKTQSITTQLLKNGYFTGMIGKHGSEWCQFSVPPHGRNEQTGMGRNPEKYFAFARQFLARAKEEKKPFFLAANAHDPHRYWARHPDESKRWIDQMMGDTQWNPFSNGKPYPDPQSRFKPKECPVPPPYPNEPKIKETLANYYDSVNRMDQVVGGVLKALEESGLDKNTLVLFLSDHGMAWDLSKWSLYPSGVRTPILIRWPEKVKAGQIDSQSIVSVVDIAPTIAELCGLPPITKTDGKSFSSLLEGRSSSWKRSSAFSCFNYMNNDPQIDDTIQIFSSDLPLKFDQYRPSRALNDQKFCYIWNGWADGKTALPGTMLGEFNGILNELSKSPTGSGYKNLSETKNFIKFRIREELYDLSQDPGCHTNLSHHNNHQTTLNDFRIRMKEVLQKTNDHEIYNFQTFLKNK